MSSRTTPRPSMITFMLSLLVLTIFLLPIDTPHTAATDESGHAVYLPLVITYAPYLADRREVIRLVNIEREAAGCSAAYENPILMHATQAWSAYMHATGTLAHTSAYPGDWYADHGWPHVILGETIAGNTSPQGVVDLWMTSDWHRAALLTCEGGPDYRYEIGVGSVVAWTLAISAD